MNPISFIVKLFVGAIIMIVTWPLVLSNKEKEPEEELERLFSIFTDQ